LFQPAQTNLFQGVQEWQTLLRQKTCASKRCSAQTQRKLAFYGSYLHQTYLSAIAAGDYAVASEAYKKAVPVIDRMADKGIIHKNKAARHKSRLNAQVKALAN
jgi:small subunit ribosomal protein S20